tara:strand:+ start:506 stop:658 length:153 start_codon:yes stop_codon:yes gene_type:complete
MTTYLLVITGTESEIDDAIAQKKLQGYIYSGNKHYNEDKQHWVANFTKES